jgi:hypothetical protein
LKRDWRRYPALLLYASASLVATLLEIQPNIAYYTGGPRPATSRASIYWFGEGVLFPLLFVSVIGLLWHATERLRSRRAVRALIVASAVLFAGISFLLHYRAALNTGEWMTPWTRDLNFGSAIIDMALWVILVGSRTKDRQLMVVSGGLGIQFAGGALGGAIRNIVVAVYRGPTPAARMFLLVGDSLIMLANLACLLLLRRAFRPQPAGTESLPGGKKEPATRLL